MNSIPLNIYTQEILQESLDALLVRVRWYTARRIRVPTKTAYAFNMLANWLGHPSQSPWTRIV